MLKEMRSLTPSELRAKEYMMNVIENASLKPCDSSDGSTISPSLPKWYNQEQFKRGQKYFTDNRFGVLLSNLYGLVALMAIPKGLDVLDVTGKSSTAETAKNRYVTTLVYLITWYEDDLHPDSTSWATLNKVRKMHLNASNIAVKKKMGNITQTEMALTTFGLIGFALVRPQYLGIRCDNKEDREGFIHFWAVIGHMLGVDDAFNMCLFDIETVETICLIMQRYIFIPIIQLEPPKFQQMTKALLKGMSSFMPHMSYGAQMFLLKRIIGVPGYQYNVDLCNEKVCKRIFSAHELNIVNEVVKTVFKGKSNVYDILFNDGIPIETPNTGVHFDMPMSNNGQPVQNNYSQSKLQCIEIKDRKSQSIMRSTTSSDDWRVYLNDSQFFALSKWDQITVRWLCWILKCIQISVGKYFCEAGLGLVLFFIRRHYNRNMARKN